MIPLSSVEEPVFKRRLSSRYSSLLNVYSGASTIAKRFKNLIQDPHKATWLGRYHRFTILAAYLNVNRMFTFIAI